MEEVLSKRGIALTEFCTDTAKSYCRDANKMIPAVRTDKEYCNLVRMWDKCFFGVSKYCSLVFQAVLRVVCIGIALTEFCTDTAKSYCREANDKYPNARTDEEYCKNCFDRVFALIRRSHIAERRTINIPMPGLMRNTARITLTEFCTDTAKSYCREANDKYPYARTDEEYCKRVRMWVKCFVGVSKYCSLVFKTVIKVMCIVQNICYTRIHLTISNNNLIGYNNTKRLVQEKCPGKVVPYLYHFSFSSCENVGRVFHWRIQILFFRVQDSDKSDVHRVHHTISNNNLIGYYNTKNLVQPKCPGKDVPYLYQFSFSSCENVGPVFRWRIQILFFRVPDSDESDVHRVIMKNIDVSRSIFNDVLCPLLILTYLHE
ncbi:Hypothetical predicted protein [Octopus vulgaris]|uniref:Uncharacterized protein n=1 Tax=Octopus vulgaris TaxID=6645 RepID=A0AA36FG20_OCTVU|nr:Hypothetical predicted protein [Octopus vulgaris]